MFSLGNREPLVTAPFAEKGTRGWMRAWEQPRFRWQLGLGLTLGIILAFGMPHYFAFIEARVGKVLADPLLPHLPARDMSWTTFTIIYLCILLALIHLGRRPGAFVRVLWAYCIMHLIRIGTLWFAPLDPPTGLVLLHDPIVDTLFYPTNPITKDLFFSGHTATIMLLALGVRSQWLQRLLLLATVAIGFLVLVQHAHYTYDVVAAPFFAALSFWLAGKVVRK
ncbi:phosphatase PAP2-related protein [Hymenobacter cavernae]|nr:phosphatase PAP2-related protein [Hymenobacter cavernae]